MTLGGSRDLGNEGCCGRGPSRGLRGGIPIYSDWAPLIGLVSGFGPEHESIRKSTKSSSQNARRSVIDHSVSTDLGRYLLSCDSAQDPVAADMYGPVPRDELYKD